MEAELAKIRAQLEFSLKKLDLLAQELSALLDSWGSEHLIKHGSKLKSAQLQLSKLRELNSELGNLKRSLVEWLKLSLLDLDPLKLELGSEVLLEYLELAKAGAWDQIPQPIRDSIQQLVQHRLTMELQALIRDPQSWPHWFRSQLESYFRAQLESELESKLQHEIQSKLQQRIKELELRAQELESWFRAEALRCLVKLWELSCGGCGSKLRFKLSSHELGLLLKQESLGIQCSKCGTSLELKLADLIRIQLESPQLLELPRSSAGMEFLFPDEFSYKLQADLSSARERVVIFCPFTSSEGVDRWIPEFLKLGSRKVELEIHVLDPESSAISNKQAHALNLEKLRMAGAKLILRKHMHEKSVIIDRRVVYLGSLNLLSKHGIWGDFMLRIAHPGLVEKLGGCLEELARYSEQLPD